MRRPGVGGWVIASVAVVLAACGVGWGKAKQKATLPAYVLKAHRVAVLVDPQAGVSIEDPRANQVAQKDVESALMDWGRYEPVMGSDGADLLIVIRRGHGRLVDDTIPDPRQNSRAGVINGTPDGVGIGAQHGQQQPLGGGGVAGPGSGAQTQAEIGGVDDEFVVYQGGVERPLDGAPVWRWVRKDGLHPHDVPAVAEFRKAVAEADKALAAAQAGKKP